MLALIFILSAVFFIIVYRFYGRYLNSRFNIKPEDPTPAQLYNDGVDYVPSPKATLLGHHFSSIAGAGPIVGPIIASISFGWLPALIWIVIGSAFVGGVHDFGSLVASIRHKALSLGQVAKSYLSPLAYRVLLIFIWLALVYIIIVFVDLTTLSFIESPEVSTSSAYFIVLAVIFGLITAKRHNSLLWPTIIFVPLVFFGIVVGFWFPIDNATMVFAGNPMRSWNLILIAYAFIASVSPVWILLQPRDYLSSFLLYGSMLGAFIGILFGGFNMQYPAFITFIDPSVGGMFPILFITVACGACSGFHSIVASGTTSKQLANEAHARPVAYGSMLIEGLIAIVSLITVAMLPYTVETKNLQPLEIYGRGMGQFLAVLGIPTKVGHIFGILAVSAFLLTTLDTGTRLARYVFEELTNLKGKFAGYMATAISLALPIAFNFITLTDAKGNPIPVWKAIWPVFGATNQLLAALALLVVFIWFRSRNRNAWFIGIPMVFMMAMTGWALIELILKFKFELPGIVSMLLLTLAITVGFEVVKLLIKTSKS